jgi:hypothetical protein
LTRENICDTLKKEYRSIAPGRRKSVKNRLLIIGDSYSTFKGMIPEGYAAYYSEDGVLPDVPVTKMHLEDTWWIKFINATGIELVLNNSWSGSTVCYSGREGDCSRTSSYIFRYRQLKENGFFKENDIDIVIVFGGTNDSWIDSPLGELKFDGIEENELYSVLPAISHLMGTIKEDLPNARILFIANSDIKEVIISAIKTSGEHYGVDTIALHDVHKESGHPTPEGMTDICDQVLEWWNK